VDLTVKQAEVSMLLDDLDRSQGYLLQAAEGATTLESHLLLEDVQTIYSQMQKKWPKESSVRDLGERLNIQEVIS
jgi:hypothetical protein